MVHINYFNEKVFQLLYKKLQFNRGPKKKEKNHFCGNRLLVKGKHDVNSGVTLESIRLIGD